MKRKYIYKGNSEIFMAGIGIIKPGQIIETESEIKNANFYLYKEKKLKVNKSK